jgi:hypothetical protein
MSHNPHLKESIEAQTGRSTLWLIGTLMGGLLVVNSFVAEWLFEAEQISAIFALIGAISLSLPLAWHSITHLIRGEAHMDELVTMAIVPPAIGVPGGRRDRLHGHRDLVEMRTGWARERRSNR